MVTIDICVCTFKRSESLDLLLASLFRQEPPDVNYKIIVVDNDAQQSACEVVKRYPGITYECEPLQNISLARNRAISLGTGNYVAMIDDDEIADRWWLKQLYNEVLQKNADVAFGHVVKTLGPSAPKWALYAKAYENLRGETTYTTNCLFRRSLVEDFGIFFDPRYGQTGGEDIDFFDRLRKCGAKEVYCSEAISTEDFTNRANLKWLIRRRFRIGCTANKVSPGRVSQILALKKCSVLLVISIWWLFAYRLAPRAFAFQIESLCYHLGILAQGTLGYILPEYASARPTSNNYQGFDAC